MALQGINHIVLKVRSLETSDRFYQEMLGMQRVAERHRMWFYHAGGHHHDLALVEVGSHAIAPQTQATGLFHICFNVSNEQALAKLHNHCKSFGVTILGAVDHTVMRSFYVLDLDRNVIEFGVDVPQAEWEHLPAPFSRDVAYSLPSQQR